MLTITSTSTSLRRVYDGAVTGGVAPPTASSYQALKAVTFDPLNGLTSGAPDGFVFFQTAPPAMLKVFVIGKDAANKTVDCRVLGYEPTRAGVWVPAGPLCEYQGILLGARVGTGTTGDFRASEFMADTIADPVVGNKNTDTSYYTNGADVAAFFVVATRGIRLFLIDLKTGGTGTAATECNALVGVSP